MLSFRVPDFPGLGVNDVRAERGELSLIDWDYVHHWCEQHGTRSLLDEIRASIPVI
jgi:hypothetical protein